ncbi:CRISPR-associated helicase Cas3' [Halorussus lipolyticus]|uniref:CRISPR-associated helicase Cas3' n=1 Tax=Halorussus lipolyticus TaxID=3034024 RepID=UPI0023E8B67F|nr:CRISPR-associated helicase Cas3' [Halorussus sp. DT80]
MSSESDTDAEPLYAKSDPPTSLDTHLQAVADATVTALDSSATARAALPAETTSDRLRDLGRLAGLLHDTGKAHPDWQAKCQHAIETGENVTLPNHSARSALVAFALTASSDGIPVLHTALTEVERAALLLAVLHHHTPISESNHRANEHLIDGADCDALFEQVSETETVGDWSLQIDALTALSGFREFVKQVRKRPGSDEQFHEIASITTILRSALIQADHHASSQAGDGPPAPLPTSLTAESIEFYDELRPFQQTVADYLDGDTPDQFFGLAGCGAGKTQTALQWGAEQCRAGNADRLVIAMPTRTTSNNLFQTVTNDHADPDDVALYHSTSGRVYTEKFSDERELETINEYPRRCKWFQQPITICTVDHLLATLVNNDKHSDIARGNLRRAAVVFDEVHAYDRQLLQAIAGAVEYFDAIELPWYVMTATCPPELEAALDPTETVHDPREDHSPYHVKQHDHELTAEVVADSLASGDARTAMVVKNTVRSAQTLARQLAKVTPSDVSVTYYSSEFPSYDRRAKEREVREQFAPGDVPTDERRILVCTQVCELSLDISVDTLYTDLAPADAVIQRAGRLHRRGNRPDAEDCDCEDCAERMRPVEYVCNTYFDPTASAWYPYATGRNTPEWNLLLATRDALDAATAYSFEASRHWIAEAYSAYNLQVREQTFRGAIANDSMFGPPRWDGNRISFRTGTHRRLPVVASPYDLHDNDEKPVPFSYLWETFDSHDCCGHCGLETDRYTPCHEALQEAIEEYSIEIPAYWLLDDDIRCHSSEVFPDAPRVSLPEVSLHYSYQWGIQNPTNDATTDTSAREF